MRKLKLGPAPAPETAGERGMIISVTEAIHLPSHRGMLQYHQPHHTTTTLPRMIMIIAVYNLQLL